MLSIVQLTALDHAMNPAVVEVGDGASGPVAGLEADQQAEALAFVIGMARGRAAERALQREGSSDLYKMIESVLPVVIETMRPHPPPEYAPVSRSVPHMVEG